MIFDMIEKGSAVDNRRLAEYTDVLRRRYPLNNRILLVQSPQFLFDSLNIEIIKKRGYYAYPPTGLQCIAKALSNRNFEIEILDMNYQFLKKVISDPYFNYSNWLEILDEYLIRNNPSIVGVTALSVSCNVLNPAFPLTNILSHLREKNEHIIIAGGPIATNEYESYLKKQLCHFVVGGEGENKINFLFDYLYGVKPTHTSVPHIYFWYEGCLEETEGKKDNVNLSGNLINTYKLVPIEDYNNVGSLNPFSRMAGQDKRFTGIQLNRGCRANCKFCGVTKFMGKGIRQYAVEDLMDEIYYLVEEKGIRHFEILDDDFLGPSTFKEGVKDLLRRLSTLSQQYGITWSAGNGLIAASLNEEMLCLMRDSGCIGFRIGIESGNAVMLKKMRKPASLSSVKRFGRTLQKFPEMFVAGNYIIGLFGEETFGEMLDTFNFANGMNLDGANFTIFQFTSKVTIAAEKLNYDNREAKEFIPTKDNSRGEIAESEGVFSGPDIFTLSKETIPSPEQIKQIWFSFNLIANYINNKNLKPSGRPDKLAAWLEAVQIAYPDNPYMALFTGLSYSSLGENESALSYYNKTRQILEKSAYWMHRFKQFSLTDILIKLPQNVYEVQDTLDPLRKRFSEWTG